MCSNLVYIYSYYTLSYPMQKKEKVRRFTMVRMELALVVIGCIFDNYFLLLTLDLLTA